MDALEDFRVLTIDEEKQTWMNEIMEYIVNVVLLMDKSEACKLGMKSAKYCMFKGNL